MDWARGGTAPEIIERDDGFTDLSVGHELYVAEFKDWPLSERRSMRYVHGASSMWVAAQGGSPCTFSSAGSMLLGWMLRLSRSARLGCVA